jgi:2-methylcitrate dehydratase PrpD
MQTTAGMGRGETQALSRFATDLKFDTLPKSVREKARLTLLDYLGTSLLAAQERPACILREVVRELGGTPEASVIGDKLRTNAPWAALINGALGHMCELDDTHRGSDCHPGECVWAAVLAAGEQVGTSGRDAVTAAVAGYEVAIRIGEAVMPSHTDRGWHASGTITTFGAAVAAGKLLGLDAAGMASALGIAATQTAGSLAYIGDRAMTKDFNPGRAAMNGVLAARLAARGFTGPIAALEHAYGFGALYASDWHPEVVFGSSNGRPPLESLVTGDGGRFAILEVAHKPYTACRSSHSAIEATLGICEENGLQASDVRRVIARIYRAGADYVNDPTPWEGSKGLQGARFSTQFNLAVVLRERRAGLDALLDSEEVRRRLDDPTLRAEMSKVEVIPDEELNADWPRSFPTIVELETVGGARFIRRVDFPTGEPEAPISASDLERKFRRVTGLARLTDGAQTQAIRFIQGLDNLSGLTDLIQIFTSTSAV